MNYLNPIYTERRECQDCYKCVRNCPVKAIKVEGGYASVVPELCVLCGHCVEVCPNGAKQVRDDLPRARQLLAMKGRVIVSLAPSFVSEFVGVRPAQLVAAVRRLGFFGVSETALGAQHVSATVAGVLQQPPSRVLISSACPSVVAYLQKYHPAHATRLTGLLSPLLAHCKLLRQSFGPDIGIVFVGPCIGKKQEADTHAELLDVALTFEDLRRWLKLERIVPEMLIETDADGFIPEAAAEGALYPVDGGMIAGIKSGCGVADCSFMAFSGLGAINKALAGLEEMKPEGSLFLELLACEGGCINGPKIGRKAATIAKRCQVLRYGEQQTAGGGRGHAAQPPVPIDCDISAPPAQPPQYSEAQLREALRSVGKVSIDDEINCGGCGYDSCREFAQALMQQKAERAMCVTYMRKLALKKANALIQKMPSAVVIVDETLRVLECNARFAEMFAAQRGADPAAPGVEGAMLTEVLPFHPLFASVLRTGEDIVDKDIRHRQTILHLSVFTIEKHRVVGGIIQDITKPAVRKEQVIRKAREVIQKNLATVQKIAALLGENAAESETTLNSIIDSFSPGKIDEIGGDSDWRELYRR